MTGLVSYAGYDIADVERNGHAFAPALEQVHWYQHLFQLERGRECLTQHRRELCRILWEQWSPGWTFDDATFERTAASFDNPDFVDVVIHCYRFCFGREGGDPALVTLEDRLAEKPRIGVPTVTLDGTRDPLKLAVPRITPGCSPAVTSIASWTAATTCRGRRPMTFPTRS